MFLTDVLKIGIEHRKKMGIDRVCVFDSKESMLFTWHYLLHRVGILARLCDIDPLFFSLDAQVST